MLYKLTKTINGKTVIDSVDTLPVINRRKKELSSSYRGQNVKLDVSPAEDEEKYRKPPNDRSWCGGDYARNKSKVKGKIKSAKRHNKGNNPS